MTLLLSCVLYTLQDRSPSENKYIPIFITWLAHVFKYADLASGDALRLTIDADTHEQLKKTPFYTNVMSALNCEKQLLIIERPKTHAEGMMSRFIEKEYTQTTYMYCDIDILIKKPLRELTSLVSQNTIAVHVEGTMADSNYNMLFPKEWVLENGAQHVGFSSGKFIINGHELYRDLFRLAGHIYKQHPIDDFYAPDQCVYNYAVYMLPRETYTLDMTTIRPPSICINGHNETEKVILLDLMGEPGNGTLHFDKIFGTLIEYFLTH